MSHGEHRRHCCWQLALAALVWMTGCAAGHAGGRPSTLRDLPSEPGGAWEASAPQQREASSPETREGRNGSGFFTRFREKQDDFQLLQESAGLEEEDRHAAGEELETEDARTLWEKLARTRATLTNFASRRTLAFLLRQLLTSDEDVSYAEVLRRVQRFRLLAVMRPDGYLASALSGRPLQRMGRLELRGGRLMAGSFEVGNFYRDRGGVFYAVDEALQPLPFSLGELGLEHDWFNAALDGAEDAMAELAVGMAALVTHPIRSIEGLAQLPSGVAALISSSPAYFARYSALPLQEQIREAARLSTHLLMLYGSAAGSATRLGSVGARLPVLSLTAEGAADIEQVAVPAGATATALGTGTGVVYVLMESAGDPDEGPRESGATEEQGRLTSTNPNKAIKRLREQIQEHRQKLNQYRQNPDAFDNQGVLKNAPSPEIRQRIIQGRINHLEKEIQAFEKNIRDLGGEP